MCISACPLFLAIATMFLAQEAPSPSVTQTQRVEALQDIDKVGAELQKLGDWDDQYLIIHDAISNVFEQNGWQSEEHRFARDLANRVAQIPPWEIDQRIKALADGVGDRYELSKNERYQLQGTILRESLGLIWNNRSTLTRHVQEQVEMRTRGEAFTPEMVARWVREGQPIFDEANERIERLYNKVGEMIDDEHRALLDRDLKSFHERQKVVEQMAEKWANGQWSPEQWGLQNDPIHQRAELQKAQARAEAAQAEDGIALAYDPSTWPFLVRQRARLYEFDRSQITAAESILVELQEQGSAFLSAHGPILASIPVSQRAEHESFAGVRAVFDELVKRVDRLATETQRHHAATQRTESPAGSPTESTGGDD